MPPAAADQFFTSGASSLMHSNKTTLKNLINCNHNNNNNNNCPHEQRSVSRSAAIRSCSCLRQRSDQDQLNTTEANRENNKDQADKKGRTQVQCDLKAMTVAQSDVEHLFTSTKTNCPTKFQSISDTHRPSCTNIVTGLSHSYCK